MPGFSPIVILTISALLCGLLPSPCAAQADKDSSIKPIHIEADRMEADQRQEAVTFAGNVEAVQGELVIRGDRMVVHYRKNAALSGTEANVGQNVESLEATGNIKLEHQDWRASGDRMDYETVGRKVVLTGNTKVWRDSNMVTGDRVVLYLDEGKSVVESREEQGGRVKAFFYPEPTETEEESGNEK